MMYSVGAFLWWLMCFVSLGNASIGTGSWGQSFLDKDISKLLDLDIGSYFTDIEKQSITSQKRVRREMRDIEYSEWLKVANAMNVMKFTDQQTGMALYGNKFINYDKLVCWHARIAFSRVGDINHLNPAFGPWHRAFLLIFEESILAIDPSIDAVPYWDYRRDADDPINSIVWTDLYFGQLMGDSENGYAIKDGPFAYWPINEDAESLGCKNIQNIWGQMRNNVHQEKSRYVTRMGSAMCNKTNTNIGTSEEWDECLDVTSVSSYMALDSCYESTFHYYSHAFVGGARPPDSGDVIQSDAAYDSDVDSCLSWSGDESIEVYNHKIGILYSHPQYGCFDCPNDCDYNDTSARCTSCKVVNSTCSFEAYNVSYSTTLYRETEEYIWGDMADPIASPNDPFFWFHHINLDRFVFIWELHLSDASPYYYYPTTGYETGINLDDIVGDEWPLTNVFDVYDAAQAMTIRDIFDATTFVNCPYTYDDFVGALEKSSSKQSKLVTKVVKLFYLFPEYPTTTTLAALSALSAIILLLLYILYHWCCDYLISNKKITADDSCIDSVSTGSIYGSVDVWEV